MFRLCSKCWNGDSGTLLYLPDMPFIAVALVRPIILWLCHSTCYKLSRAKLQCEGNLIILFFFVGKLMTWLWIVILRAAKSPLQIWHPGPAHFEEDLHLCGVWTRSAYVSCKSSFRKLIDFSAVRQIYETIVEDNSSMPSMCVPSLRYSDNAKREKLIRLLKLEWKEP